MKTWPEWMRVPDVVEYAGVSKPTLDQWRVRGEGPRYTKRGRLVWYRKSWIDEFFEAGMRTSTSERVSDEVA
ncbi:helix-turn-helix transcriptional regulator [Inquilinus sp. CA228]|uniref:helix-turn-helix transcriptional regulator n=1 Tax=Inquilinus sp. CA228 TaxID=3455609 RepID=UPI003F8D6E5C